MGTCLQFGLHRFMVRGLLFFLKASCGFGCIRIAGLTAVVERLENWRHNFSWSCTHRWNSCCFKTKFIQTR